jgi:diguanylate cyclase (GGDEF)-like protein
MSNPGLSEQINVRERQANTFGGTVFSNDERRALLEEISLLKERILDLEHAADTDPLVPVYNRRAFIREIEKAQTVMSRYQIPSSLIFFDLNGFKSINDRFGHGIGDEFLLKVGEILHTSVRDCDMVARIGGDEFGVLLFKTTEEIARAKAATLACRISEQKISIPTGDITLSAAWGISACSPELEIREILDRADRAMYEFKNLG